MKKLIFSFLLLLPCVLEAQVIFTDSVRHQLMKHLFENGDALKPDSYKNGNLWITSILTRNHIKKPNQKSHPVDIFTFYDTSPHTYHHIFLIAGTKSQIINMRQSYDKIIQDLLDFFKQNPEIDDRLLPLFNYQIHKTFIRNTNKHQKGRWFDFWNQQDSLSRQLEIEYVDWVN